MLTKHANDVSGLKVDAIIRGGIRKFTDEVGRLWTSLADYYIRRGLFEKARDIYEEGMTSVITVRDFSMIFDAYTQFEESMLAAKMETLDASDNERELTETENRTGSGMDTQTSTAPEADGSMASNRKGPLDSAIEIDLRELPRFWLNDTNDINLRLARLEYLMERRPELVSSVLLRQNPHNVHEWHKRAKLFAENPSRQILTYTEAVRTVDPFKAVGKPHTLWIAFAHLYEKHNDLTNARVIFEKAVQVNYKSVDDLATVWCEWAETELRHKSFNRARALMQRATTEPSVAVKRRVQAEGDEPVQMKLYRSLKVWSFYVDLEESLGSLESTREIYERIIDLKIATPQMIINYALLLEDHKYFEDAFKVYEKGVQIFKYPHVRDIWTTYLSKFVKRYGGSKLERARDLFEQAVEKAPAEDVKPLYLQYAKLEEDYGLAGHAMAVYDRATKAVKDDEKMAIYEIYIARAAEFFGVPKTRSIYEQAIESGLPDKDVKTMCMKYADLEKNLVEIDRARAIYVHASQMADPRSDTDFWEKWNEFEVQHGNEDTFREMLRIKRSVSASYSQMHFILPEYLMQKDQGKVSLEETVDNLKRAGVPDDEMVALERQLAPAGAAVSNPRDGLRALGFVSAGVEIQGNSQRESASAQHALKNADEIELQEEEESDAEEEKVEVSQREVPGAVFGGLEDAAKQLLQHEESGGMVRERETEEPMGALERIKRQRRQ